MPQNTKKPSEQNETQNEKPEFETPIEVGITNLKTKIVVNEGDKIKVFIPTIELMLKLPGNIKGAHMSRLVQAINEHIHIQSPTQAPSMEQLCKSILDNLDTRHETTESRISLTTEYAKETISPVSQLQSTEVHDIVVTVHKADTYTKTLTVTVKGGSACPHAMNNNELGRTHLQRSIIIISAKTSLTDNNLTISKLIEVAESSFSARVYSLVKSTDEQHIINDMFEHPKFVEDICRDVERQIRNEFTTGDFNITVINQESIHRHDVKANKQFILE